MNNSSVNNDLLCDFKKGNKVAFKKIYVLYYQDLCCWINSYTKDKDLAEDLVQNAFLKLWEQRGKLAINDNIKSYLFKLVYNSFLDKIRRDNIFNKKIEEIRYSHIIASMDEDQDIQEKRLNILKQSIDDLPKKCKEVFILSKYDGLKYQQIADQLGISKNTVEVQISKAYKILRKSLLNKNGLSLFISFLSRRITLQKTKISDVN
ncbi:RNA polymerase sigma-70 factor [Aestuariibaculum suncheonense]|uniref:RNA polymerase sigma-70 factor n=1 Tax=Aestuariibaculum suncheonense TaxID=1028745 RepID=A0A8J6QH09_9FLAO|nr:RNA polymerase sigma-70 factor [Aestuariibaculum suncheonense]MBD0835662.1 RNA polymerase sigma-70 factor [Aestuariibaculum suncheonense]